MDYELAKQLKDAGFPQELKLGGGVYYDNGKDFHIVCTGAGHECDCTTDYGYGCGMVGLNEPVHAPTLSELIESCGLETFILIKLNEWWECNDGRFTMEKGMPILFNPARGSSPEEAVARLWLALNKK